MPERFVADSGYILKQEGIAFLLKVKGNDTIDVNNSDLDDTDTIGKYYKTKTGNYLAYILDIINPDNNRWAIMIKCNSENKIIKSEQYTGGGYLCSLNNAYDALQKQGDYFSFKYASGNGPGYCSEDIFLFKDLEPQSLGVTNNVWSTKCVYQQDETPALACNLTSTMSIKFDTVSMHYKLEHIAFEGKDDEIQKVKSTEFFDIKYIKKETGWIAIDSTNISKIPE